MIFQVTSTDNHSQETTEDMTIKTKDVLNWDVDKIGNRKIRLFSGFRGYNDCIERIRLGRNNSLGLLKPRVFLYNDNIVEPNQDLTNNNNPESFHRAIGSVLGLAQFFGLLPVFGVRSPSSKNLSFRKYSLRTIYAFLIILLMLFMALSSVVHMMRMLSAKTFETHGGIAAVTAGAAFYGNNLFGAIIFLWLAPRWAPLQHEWQATEHVGRLEYPRLRWKFSVITAIVLLLALIEHILSIVNNTPSYMWQRTENVSFSNFLHAYSLKSHAFILSNWNYNIVLGIFIFAVSKIATFIWNFMDLFIMLISTGLAERYKVLNNKMTKSISENHTVADWRIFRECYGAMSNLVKKVDNDVSPIVLLSFANNLYFICLQLLNGISPQKDDLLSSIYFFGSFGFLVSRTVAVTLMAARVHDQSKLALPIIYTCPSSTYCVETQRLQHQLTTDDIALTGLRFFSITRNFMLAVAGAIFTYELVFLQFNVAMDK